MKGFGDNKRSKEHISNKQDFKPIKENLIKLAFKYHLKGEKYNEAKCYEYFIKQGYSDYRVFNNYGAILKSIRKYKEAELYTRKALELKPNYPNAYYNLGCIYIDIKKLKEAELYTRKALALKADFFDANYNLGFILRDLGKLEESEKYLLKTIKLNSECAKAYMILSTLNYSRDKAIWIEKLFSKSLLIGKTNLEKVDIYFARANILHKEAKFKLSAENLSLANNIKLKISPSNADKFIAKSRNIMKVSPLKELKKQRSSIVLENIFIVGMFRSGSTLIESILSTNNIVKDLGEVNFLEGSYEELNNISKTKTDLTLNDIYLKKIRHLNKKARVFTNKWLDNYIYTGIIVNQISNTKIIHCIRNPLDNILSIYRAHFAGGSEYSSSLVDSTKIYLNQKWLMKEYKSKYSSYIYELNYENLVSDPEKEIKTLISWLGWDWDDSYLEPHLNKRVVSTRSNVEVRSPINSNSIGGWRNYKDMLKPAIDILKQNNEYQELI